MVLEKKKKKKQEINRGKFYTPKGRKEENRVPGPKANKNRKKKKQELENQDLVG